MNSLQAWTYTQRARRSEPVTKKLLREQPGHEPNPLSVSNTYD
jgi:hypothetical protein